MLPFHGRIAFYLQQIFLRLLSLKKSVCVFFCFLSNLVWNSNGSYCFKSGVYKNDIVVAGHKTRDENDCWMKCHARKDCSHFTYYKISEHPGFNGDCYLKNKKRLDRPSGNSWYGKPKFIEANHHLSHLIISGEKRCLTGAEAGRNLNTSLRGIQHLLLRTTAT